MLAFGSFFILFTLLATKGFFITAKMVATMADGVQAFTYLASASTSPSATDERLSKIFY